MPITLKDILDSKLARTGPFAREDRHIGSTEGEFSVVQFFVSGQNEYVRRFVSVEEAVEAFRHYTTSVAVKLGFVTQVLITDMMNCTCMQWLHGKGVVFPTPEQLEELCKDDAYWAEHNRLESEREADEENLKGRKDRELDADWDPDEEESSFTKDPSSM